MYFLFLSEDISVIVLGVIGPARVGEKREEWECRGKAFHAEFHPRPVF